MNAKPFLAALALVAGVFAGPALAGPAVSLEPVQAQVDRNWLYDLKDSRAKPGAISEAQVRKIADDMAAGLQAELGKALLAEGFELASPGAARVRLVARIDNLRLNAPDSQAAGVHTYSREAGRATLSAEARDASGAVVLKTEERAEAGDSGGRLQRASEVSNRFWFDAMFREWAAGVARELKAKAR
jgi:hypothetical protein